MYANTATGEKAPDRPQRVDCNLQSMPELNRFGNSRYWRIRSREQVIRQNLIFSEIGTWAPITKRAGYSRHKQPTDSDRTRPQFHTVARAVRPRSHNSETMIEIARIHGKSTGYCNYDNAPEVGQ